MRSSEIERIIIADRRRSRGILWENRLTRRYVTSIFNPDEPARQQGGDGTMVQRDWGAARLVSISRSRPQDAANV